MNDENGQVQIEGGTLGLGEQTGALVVYEQAGSRGESVFAGPKDDKRQNRRDLSAPVLRRTVNGRPVFAAVFTRLVTGAYDATSPWGGHESRVTVEPWAVTEVDWR